MSATFTLSEAAELLGKPTARAALRHLLAVEKRAGVRIVRRWGGHGNGLRYSVMAPAMRRYCPEAFDRGSLPDVQTQADVIRAAVERAVREAMEAVDERLAELHQRDEVLRKELRELRDDAGL